MEREVVVKSFLDQKNEIIGVNWHHVVKEPDPDGAGFQLEDCDVILAGVQDLSRWGIETGFFNCADSLGARVVHATNRGGDARGGGGSPAIADQQHRQQTSYQPH